MTLHPGIRWPRVGSRYGVTTQVAAELHPETVDQMWALYGPHHRAPRARMLERLRGALDVVHLFWHRGALVGFIGMRAEAIDLGARGRACAVYMGLAYIHVEHRSRHLIQRAVLRQMLSLGARHPGSALYFWTDAVSYKPYL